MPRFTSFENDDLRYKFENDDGMNLEERLKLFTIETFDIESTENTELKKSLDYLAISTAGRSLGKITGFEWLLKVLPAIYPHKHMETAREQSVIFNNPMIPLNPASTRHMVLGVSYSSKLVFCFSTTCF